VEKKVSEVVRKLQNVLPKRASLYLERVSVILIGLDCCHVICQVRSMSELDVT
jgi:hypothetical protein